MIHYSPLGTPIAGVVLFAPKPFRDPRGAFSRIYDHGEPIVDINGNEIAFNVQQVNISENAYHVFRGLHYQPDQAKFIRVVRGEVFDVVVDLRRDSPTYLQATGFRLGQSGWSLYVPPMVAHGFIALEDNTTVVYLASARWNLETEGGIRLDDPLISAQLMDPIISSMVISERDRSFPDWIK
jgi:dTDP-4-dehydrorhamnose 3,5-epimerase